MIVVTIMTMVLIMMASMASMILLILWFCCWWRWWESHGAAGDHAGAGHYYDGAGSDGQGGDVCDDIMFIHFPPQVWQYAMWYYQQVQIFLQFPPPGWERGIALLKRGWFLPVVTHGGFPSMVWLWLIRFLQPQTEGNKNNYFHILFAFRFAFIFSFSRFLDLDLHSVLHSFSHSPNFWIWICVQIYIHFLILQIFGFRFTLIFSFSRFLDLDLHSFSHSPEFWIWICIFLRILSVLYLQLFSGSLFIHLDCLIEHCMWCIIRKKRPKHLHHHNEAESKFIHTTCDTYVTCVCASRKPETPSKKCDRMCACMYYLTGTFRFR